MIKNKNVTYLEIVNSGGIPTGEDIIVTGGVFEKKRNSKVEIVAMETIIHNSLPQNKIINFIKNDRLKNFKIKKFEKRMNSIVSENEFYGLTSLLEKVEEKEPGYPKNFKKQLWLHSYAGTKSVSIETLYFLMPINTENEKEFLKEGLKNRALKKMPIPIKEEWFDYLWEEVEEYFVPLKTFGLFQYKGYALRLSIERLQKAVTNIQAKMEWKQTFKRVPKYRPLLQIMNIDVFNFKEWQKFYKENVQQMEIYSPEVQEDIIRAWELFGNEKSEWIMKNKDFIHGVSWKIPQVTIRLEKEKNKKQQVRKMFQKGFWYLYDIAYGHVDNQKEFSDRLNYLYKFVNLFEELKKFQFQNLKNENWNAIEKFLDNFVYPNIEEGCEEIAKECARCGVSEIHYKDYEEWWIDNIEEIRTSPREHPTIRGKVEKYTWKMSDMSDPQAWVAGLDTYCCQHFHNIGGACVEYAILNPSTSGIFMVQNNNKTIAQSFMWLSSFKIDRHGDEYRIMVLDNIEVAGNELRSGIVDAYKDFLKKLEKYAKFFKIKAVVAGKGYSDVNIEKSFNGIEINQNHNFYASVPPNLEYSDATRQVLIKTFNWEGEEK